MRMGPETGCIPSYAPAVPVAQVEAILFLVRLVLPCSVFWKRASLRPTDRTATFLLQTSASTIQLADALQRAMSGPILRCQAVHPASPCLSRARSHYWVSQCSRSAQRVALARQRVSRACAVPEPSIG